MLLKVVMFMYFPSSNLVFRKHCLLFIVFFIAMAMAMCVCARARVGVCVCVCVFVRVCVFVCRVVDFHAGTGAYTGPRLHDADADKGPSNDRPTSSSSSSSSTTMPGNRTGGGDSSSSGNTTHPVVANATGAGTTSTTGSSGSSSVGSGTGGVRGGASPTTIAIGVGCAAAAALVVGAAGSAWRRRSVYRGEHGYDSIPDPTTANGDDAANDDAGHGAVVHVERGRGGRSRRFSRARA